MSKRRRGVAGQGIVVTRRAARPIDKELKFVNQLATNAMTTTQLKVVTFPGTVVGLRWDISGLAATAGSQVMSWVIVIVSDGDQVTNISQTDGADYYTPEQNVLAFGTWSMAPNTAGEGIAKQWIGTTKTMRKLKQGDQLLFASFGSAAGAAFVNGVVQFFFKT